MFVGAAAILVAAATLIFNIRKNSIQKDIDAKEKEIKKEQEIKRKNQILHTQKDILQAYSDYVNAANSALKSLPKIKQDNLDKIDEVLEACYHEGLSYDIDTGALTISNLRFEDPDQINTTIDALFALDLFESDVDYGGYTIDEVPENAEGVDEATAKYPVAVDSLTLYLKGEAE